MPDRRVIYQGQKIDLALQTILLSDGSTADREVVLHRGAVALLPMVDQDRVCLIRNARYAVDETLMEIPAGTLDQGETPESAAVRELQEETGYVAGRMEFISSWWVSPGVMNEKMFLYRCLDLTSGPSSPELDEQLDPIVVRWSEAVSMVLDGRILDAKTRLAILLEDRLRNGGGDRG